MSKVLILAALAFSSPEQVEAAKDFAYVTGRCFVYVSEQHRMDFARDLEQTPKEIKKELQIALYDGVHVTLEKGPVSVSTCQKWQDGAIANIERLK